MGDFFSSHFGLLLQQEIVNLTDVSSLTKNENYYQTLLLCLKELEVLKGQVSARCRHRTQLSTTLNKPK